MGHIPRILRGRGGACQYGIRGAADFKEPFVGGDVEGGLPNRVKWHQKLN